MKFTKLLTQTLFLFVLSLSVVFVACKDDDDDKTPETVDTNEIGGKWQLTGIKTNAGADVPELGLIKVAAPCVLDLKFTFTSNNKVTSSDCPQATIALSPYVPITAETKWKVENGNLSLTNGTDVKTFPITQAKDEMKITISIELTPGTKTNGLLVFKRI